MTKYLPWILLLTILFPAAELVIYFVRFGAPDSSLVRESLIFAPIGFIGSLMLFYVYDRSRPGIQRKAVVFGFLLAVPFALLGGVMGGLFGYLGAVISGIVPLGLGVLIGGWIGRKMDKNRNKDKKAHEASRGPDSEGGQSETN